ncbi:MAG: trigger factor [Candidatus Marinimicrobia bacterium]|nr:trigger factor [Candidatus Neomarinimicrobiota bacterium]|tara:strand:+ start:7922 stop:9283 length:1362 start_codon:yes stop_codon:yes gene_type:complete
MKVKVNSKKGLKTSLSIIVDKATIQKRLDDKLNELKTKVQLKGFRPGKVPQKVIKDQFGKAIYGEVIDTILKETSSKALEENNLKVASQPKIDLKSFGEGKDLNYTIEVETLPDVNLKPLDKINAVEYEITIDEKTTKQRLDEIAKSQQNFSDKNENEKSEKGDMVIFDYEANIDGKSFDGNSGKNIQLVLGRDLFIKGFDEQLIGVKKNDKKKVTVNLPENYPKKELINKKTDFNCLVQKIKKPSETKIDDDFAKKLGAKNLKDLKDLIKKQTSNEYKRGLDSISKKNILDQIENSHTVELPPNLIEQEIASLSQNLKKEEIGKNNEKNKKIAKSRIKIGIILNQIAEKNKLKIDETEIKNEIQKQTKNMPGQEKMVMDYYQKNPSAISSLRGALFEEKIINFIKSKVKLTKKNVSIKEAEEIIKNFSEPRRESKKSETEKNKKKSNIKKKK